MISSSGLEFLGQRAPILQLPCATAMTVALVASCKSRETIDEVPSSSSSPVAPHAEERASPSPPSQPVKQTPPTTSAREWTFEQTEVGRLPEGWSASVGDWRVESAQQAPSGSHVVAQNAQSPFSVFNVALVQDGHYADVDIVVRLRAREGCIDQDVEASYGEPRAHATQSNHRRLASFRAMSTVGSFRPGRRLHSLERPGVDGGMLRRAAARMPPRV